MKGLAFFAYADNYLIDLKVDVIMDVEASRAIRQAEVGAAKTMIERTEERFGLKPERLAADTAYGSAATLNWLVNEKRIQPHIPVFDKSNREDGTFSRRDFTFDKEHDIYTCPAGKTLATTGTIVNDDQLLYRASKFDCDVCPLKMRCCPKAPARKIPRSIHEDARDVARALAATEAFQRSRNDRNRVEMLFAHLKRILRLGRLRLRGPLDAQDEFLLAASEPPAPRQVHDPATSRGRRKCRVGVACVGERRIHPGRRPAEGNRKHRARFSAFRSDQTAWTSPRRGFCKSAISGRFLLE